MFELALCLLRMSAISILPVDYLILLRRYRHQLLHSDAPASFITGKQGQEPERFSKSPYYCLDCHTASTRQHRRRNHYMQWSLPTSRLLSTFQLTFGCSFPRFEIGLFSFQKPLFGSITSDEMVLVNLSFQGCEGQ